MIDMHIHSTNSDGTKTVKEILEIAEKTGLNIISITDHESCEGYKEIDNIDTGKYFSGKIIKGIELKGQHKDLVMDILGYGFDCEKMKAGVAECYKDMSRAQIQEWQLAELYRIGNEMGLVLRPMNELVWDRDKEWGSIVFYDEMVSHDENKGKIADDIWISFQHFKAHYRHKGDPFYINRAKNYPCLTKIIEAIHNAGGKTFIAHIFEYKEIEDKIKELDEMINKYDIDGIECYYSNFTNDEHEAVLDFAKSHNLLISGGSDFHGDKKPGINIGTGKGTLKIPDSILDNWGD